MLTNKFIMKNLQRFKNKKALITGANGGIGSKLVESLKREGAKVAVTDLDTSKIIADANFDGDLQDSKFCDDLPRKVAKNPRKFRFFFSINPIKSSAEMPRKICGMIMEIDGHSRKIREKIQEKFRGFSFNKSKKNRVYI